MDKMRASTSAKRFTNWCGNFRKAFWAFATCNGISCQANWAISSSTTARGNVSKALWVIYEYPGRTINRNCNIVGIEYETCLDVQPHKKGVLSPSYSSRSRE